MTPTKEELDAITAWKNEEATPYQEGIISGILTKYRDGELVEIMGDTKPNPIDPIEHATWHSLREFKRLPIERQLKLFKEFKGALTPPTNQTEPSNANRL